MGYVSILNRRRACVCLQLIVGDVWRRARCFPVGREERLEEATEEEAEKEQQAAAAALSMFV